MLLRLGKPTYLALLLFLVYGWITWSPWHEQSQTVLHHGWEATRETFSQGASFADDVYDRLKAPLPATECGDLPTTTTPVLELESTPPSNGTADLQAASSKPYEPSPYAYVFYATEDEYACSVLVNVQRLQQHLRTKHRIFVLATETVSESYINALEQRNVTVSLQKPPPLAEGGAYYYRDCLLKLFAFKMHHIDPSLKKVIALDSDQLVMQNLDHLFESSVEVDLAAPRAYWIAKDCISSTFMLISLSDRLWNTVNDAIKDVPYDKYDMDLVNDLLSDTVMMLPGSYVTPNSHWEDWNLPKWFHIEDVVTPPKDDNSTTETNATTSASFPISSTPVNVKRQLIADLKSDLEHDRANASEGEESKHETAEKMSMEDEQMHNSSGDIFDYLEQPPSNKKPTVKPHKPIVKPHQPIIKPHVAGVVKPSKESSSDAAETVKPHKPIIKPHVAGVIKPSKESSSDAAEDSSEEVATIEPQIIDPNIELKHQHLSLETKKQHPLFEDLYELAPAVSVLHFFGLGKPWTYSLEAVRTQRPGSHPLFVEQFRIWRETALEICPAGVLTTL